MRKQQLPPTPFTAAQAAALGHGRSHLADAVARGEIVRLLRGVYLRADVELTTLVRAQAAALVISPYAVVCDRTAAWVHGVDVLRYAELDVMPPLETYVLRGHRATDRPECAGGVRDLSPSDWMLIGGVRVTTPVRTALDLGCKLGGYEALAAMDALARQCGFSSEDLRRQVPRYYRRRGVIQMRRLVPLVDPAAESSGESWTRLAMIEAGLPTPTLQHWVHVDGAPTYRLDVAYPHARVAVEYDGAAWHSDAVARERDRRRRAWLRAHGWTVVVVTKTSFSADALDAWLEEVSRALRLKSA